MKTTNLIPEIDFYTRVLVGILGIAFPILFQLISKLDDKYSSVLIVEIFNKEKVKKWFMISLISSISTIIIWTLKLQPQIQIQSLDFLIANSADILVFLSTTALIIIFFLYVSKILVYYTPSQFINYLIKKHHKNPSTLIYFEALGDIYIHNIKKENEKLSSTISRFLQGEYRKIRDENRGKPVVYPDIYYSIQYKALEELASSGNRRNIPLEYRIGGQAILIGELADTTISEETYSWLWRNINLALRYKNDNLIIYYWETAHQHYQFSYANYSFDKEDRKKEGERFLEFHIALGGLLLYQKRYECLNTVLKYTQSQPPSFYLIPQGIDRIFTNFFKFLDPWDTEFAHIAFKYGFPGLSGMGSDFIIKKWIGQYITLIFLRQYTLATYYTFENHLQLPNFPKTLSEKKFWINNLHFFEQLLDDNMKNQELLKILNYDFISPEWATKEKKLFPSDYLHILKQKLDVDFTNTEINQELSSSKVQLFEDTVCEIFEEGLKNYMSLGNENKIDENYNTWYVKGTHSIQSKDSFAEDPQVHHINFESALAEHLIVEVRNEISYTFKFIKSKKFLFTLENLFKAIENLNLNENHIIVAFGINFEHYIKYLGVKNLSSEKFKNTHIFEFKNNFDQENSLYILERTDLPQFITNNVTPEIIKKYNLKKKSNILNLYTSVIDLNKAKEELLIEYSTSLDRSQLIKSVLLSIDLLIEVRWKKNSKVIQFAEYSEYIQNGLPNAPKEILDFNNMFKL